ncbi:NAD(P)-binding protein [Hypoxylon fragiforme]|uniref:NAD(P)-binding protein n=1 Tax=Hypoxylon fragiforme TaxID=63214 RepID=UPI0020C69838|nr:NAD(P)-binding protein [Hypoxylon fragiforme]KAI2607160.1 NAD(P)-binding protein [Hypoxylon fragiforme]
MASSTTPHTTKQWILASKPTGAPVLTGPDATFKLQTVTLPPLKEGQLLCKVRYFSNDTGLRNFIQSTVAPERFYVPTVPLGSPMRSGIIAEVIESASPTYKPGDLVMDFHLGTWSELVVLDAATSQALSPLPNNLPVTHYLGAFGASGLAAYTGLAYAGGLKAGDTVVVSAAAGATGSMAVQIAAQLLGAKRVIGIAGSDAKCAWVREHLGAHACINYKSPTFVEELKAATPDEVDVYLDNVGGHVLDAMLTRMKRNGTVAVCGAVSSYNSGEPMALSNWFEVVSMRINIRGFIMLDYMDKAPKILGDLIGAAADGRIKLGEGETVVEARIEQQPETWMKLFSGGNQGKLLTKLII